MTWRDFQNGDKITFEYDSGDGQCIRNALFLKKKCAFTCMIFDEIDEQSKTFHFARMKHVQWSASSRASSSSGSGLPSSATLPKMEVKKENDDLDFLIPPNEISEPILIEDSPPLHPLRPPGHNSIRLPKLIRKCNR